MMKHLFYTLLMIGLTTACSTAQVRPYVRVGGGASWADFRGRTAIDIENGIFYWGLVSEADKTKPIPAGEFGLGVQADLGDHLLLQFEANMEQKGYRSSVETYYSGCSRCTVYHPPLERPATGNVETRITYLTFPALVGYRVRKWSVLAGPYLAFTLTAKQRISYQLLVPTIYNTIASFE